MKRAPREMRLVSGSGAGIVDRANRSGSHHRTSAQRPWDRWGCRAGVHGASGPQVGGAGARTTAAWFGSLAILLVAGQAQPASADLTQSRPTFATPVRQSGGEISVLGTLGEPWIGVADGGGVRVTTGIRPRGNHGEVMSLTLVAPNGGEEIGTGNEVEIRWERNGGGSAQIDFAWSSDGGASWEEIGAEFVQDTPGPGAALWTTPRRAVQAAVLRVRARTAAASILDESDAPFAIVDDDAPLLTLGLLANPYVERFVDLVAVADESVTTEGLRFEVDGTTVAPTGFDDGRQVFWLDTVVDGSADSLAVRACAFDPAGNEGCVDGALSVTQLAGFIGVGTDALGSIAPPFGGSSPSPGREAVAWSADGRLGLAFGAADGSTRAPRSVAILVTPEERAPLETGVSGPPDPSDSAHRRREDAAAPLRYAFHPEEAGPVRLIVPLAEEDLGDAGPRFALHGPDGPIELWVDREAGTAEASIPRLAPLVWVPGEPGPFRDLAELRTEIRSIVPNPVVAGTTITFTMPTTAAATLTVHDVTGRCVAHLFDGARFAPGAQEFAWNGTREVGGPPLPAGAYWLRLRAGDHESQARIVLLRSGGSR